MSASRDAVDATATRVTGRVALGYMTSVTLVDTPALLRRFSHRFADITFGLRAAEQGTTGLVAMLHSGELDLALIMDHKPFADLDLTPVARSPLCLTVPKWPPLAEATGVSRHVAFESMGIVNIGELVDNGLGVAFVPEFVSDRLDHVCIVPLDVELPDLLVSVAALKGRRLSAAGRALHSIFVEGSAPPQP